VCAGHPFDLTKTRLQTAGPGVYKGAIDVVKKTVAQDGITGCVVSIPQFLRSINGRSRTGCTVVWFHRCWV